MRPWWPRPRVLQQMRVRGRPNRMQIIVHTTINHTHTHTHNIKLNVERDDSSCIRRRYYEHEHETQQSTRQMPYATGREFEHETGWGTGRAGGGGVTMVTVLLTNGTTEQQHV